MRRGMFLILELLIISNLLLASYLSYWRFRKSYADFIKKHVEAEELFYLSRNAELSFLFCLANTNTSCFSNWYNFWSRKGNITYGAWYYDYGLGKYVCEQSKLSFEDFISRCLVEAGDKVYFETIYPDARSCVKLELSSNNFKTSALLISELCARKQFPYYCS